MFVRLSDAVNMWWCWWLHVSFSLWLSQIYSPDVAKSSQDTKLWIMQLLIKHFNLCYCPFTHCSQSASLLLFIHQLYKQEYKHRLSNWQDTGDPRDFLCQSLIRLEVNMCYPVLHRNWPTAAPRPADLHTCAQPHTFLGTSVISQTPHSRVESKDLWRSFCCIVYIWCRQF